jgi:uncharacterized protein YjbJ (UPF0337 family)
VKQLLHRLKGRLTRQAGWLTGDRHVEARGAVEEAGREPRERDVQRVEEVTRSHHGDTTWRADT